MPKNITKRKHTARNALYGLCLLLQVSVVHAGEPKDGMQNNNNEHPELSQWMDIINMQAPPNNNVRTFLVKEIKLIGNDAFSNNEINLIIQDVIGKQNSLADLKAAADKITTYFHEHGYFMARAYIPAQHIENGNVNIVIVPGHYDTIDFRKQIKVSDAVLRSKLGDVKSGALIEKSNLERALWLLNDLAGINVKATLIPGDVPGSSKLILDIVPKDRQISGILNIDNYGNRFTGIKEASTSITILNPRQSGDLLNLYAITAGNGLTGGNISYQTPAFMQAGKMEVGFSRTRYVLGEDFAYLNAGGTADTASVSYDYSLLRSRIASTYLQFNYSDKKLRDAAAGMETIKKSRAYSITISGDTIDRMEGGGMNNWSVSYLRGWLHADDPSSLLAGTPGAFQKWVITAARRQYINDRLSFISNFNGQLSNRNLDSSEKFSLGGPYGIRAYPKGEAAGDEGYFTNQELHWTLPYASGRNYIVQLIGFYDIGSVIINKNPLAGAGSTNHRTLMGYGFGLVGNDPKIGSARVIYARKAGSEVAQSDDDCSGRFWWQISKYF